MSAIHWQPALGWGGFNTAMVANQEESEDRSGQNSSKYDAPGWLKAVIILVAVGIWAFAVVRAIQEHRQPDPWIHLVLAAVFAVVFGYDVRRWNK